jgi:hypothetical protein
MRVELERMHVDSTLLNLHVCALNQHAVCYGYNATQCVDLTRMRVMVRSNGPRHVPAA